MPCIGKDRFHRGPELLSGEGLRLRLEGHSPVEFGEGRRIGGNREPRRRHQSSVEQIDHFAHSSLSARNVLARRRHSPAESLIPQDITLGRV